jgi:hypothetical protein
MKSSRKRTNKDEFDEARLGEIEKAKTQRRHDDNLDVDSCSEEARERRHDANIDSTATEQTMTLKALQRGSEARATLTK